MKLKKYSIGIISLGCSKNSIDSEVMCGLLQEKGYEIVDDIKKSDCVVINSCCFIEDAKKESINTILLSAQMKRSNVEKKKIILAGCLAQRHSEELKNELPEVDGFVGTGNILNITDAVKAVILGKRYFCVTEPKYLYDHNTPRMTGKNPYQYIKIADGCNNGCSYCIIPSLRGRYRSRTIESVFQEARALIEKGVKEINLISQDTAMYGTDIYKECALPNLIKKISSIDRYFWIRLLYLHPAHITDEIIDIIAENEKVCKYMDIPIQHIDDDILQGMNRKITQGKIFNLINNLRKKIPGVIIRTTLIVGFPGETEEKFNKLKDFVGCVKIDRLGVFMYSQEEGTAAAEFKKQISQKEKRARFNEIMKMQKEISLNLNKRFLGSEMNCLIEEKEEDVYIGRTYADAPDVDGVVYVQGRADRGQFVKCRIIDAMEYDLIAENYANTGLSYKNDTHI